MASVLLMYILIISILCRNKMTDEKKQRPTPSTRPEPLVEDKGLPPIKQTRPMPTVKPPKKDTPKKD